MFAFAAFSINRSTVKGGAFFSFRLVPFLKVLRLQESSGDVTKVSYL